MARSIADAGAMVANSASEFLAKGAAVFRSGPFKNLTKHQFISLIELF